MGNYNEYVICISQEQLREINAKNGIVAYIRKGNKLPSMDLIRSYQNAMKTFCEDPNLSVRNEESTFKITFFNQKTRQVVIFDRETKIFITAYKLADRHAREYIGTIDN